MQGCGSNRLDLSFASVFVSFPAHFMILVSFYLSFSSDRTCLLHMSPPRKSDVALERFHLVHRASGTVDE